MKEKQPDQIRVLAVGDIVGRPGRRILQKALPVLEQAYHYDCLIVNVENAAGGFGITPDVYKEFMTMNIDYMTSGNHIFDKKGTHTWFGTAEKLLRPENFPPGTPGTGSGIATLKDGTKIGVINLIGRVFMNHYDCPFRAAEKAVAQLREITPYIVVDLHAETTSEKTAMGWFLSGKVSFLWGTHTHIPTADARILDGHTGYQTDLGMTGPYDSVIGMVKEPVLHTFLTLNKKPFQVAKGDVRLAGTVFDICRETAACNAVHPIFLSENDIQELGTTDQSAI